MSHTLTFDLGTTYFKVGLFDESGQLAAMRHAAPPIVSTTPGRYELSADDFQRVLIDAARRVASDTAGGLSRVAAVCFATQANSFLLLDERDRPLTPIILWTDERACPAEPVIGSLSGIDGHYQTTGVPQISGLFMAAKLLWLRKHNPEVWRQASRLCLVSDYLTLWMTGRHVAEAGTAALTGLVDVHRLRWWPQALEHLGLTDAWLPGIVRAGTDLGIIRPEAAQLFGLPEDCRFIVGCLDQYAGAIGAGNVTPGGVSETTGTVLATVRCADRFDNNASRDVFQGPGFDDHTWYRMVFGSTSANLLEAYRNSLPDKPGYDALCAMAADVRAGADGLRVDVRDLSGADSMFPGLTEQHTRGHRVRAILEAVAGALDDQLKVLCGGCRPDRVRSVGGAARSDLWLQIKADRLGIPVQAIACPEPTSLGAAILAVGALLERSPGAIVDEWVRVRHTCRPSADARKAKSSG